MTFSPSAAGAASMQMGGDVKLARLAVAGAVSLPTGASHFIGVRVAGTTDDLIFDTGCVVSTDHGDSYAVDDPISAGAHIELVPHTALVVKTLGSGGVAYFYAV